MTISRIEAIDDAETVALHRSYDSLEVIDLQGKMMDTFSPPAQEPFDEAAGPGTLDQLDLCVTHMEIAPSKIGVVSALRPRIHLDRKVPGEEFEGVIDGVDGDRKMVHRDLHGDLRPAASQGEPGGLVARLPIIGSRTRCRRFRGSAANIREG